ncbi:MAG: signal recognition particle-docking protein FtsY [Treponema sp.]|jgi:fused signal recognition particle receptor|nr:signal recognition particle-docking protein FtsY [Treponema sp.]
MKFAEKIKSFFTGAPALSQEFFDELSDILVEGDLGAREAYAVAGRLQERCKKEKTSSPEEARASLAALLEDMLLPPPHASDSADTLEGRGNFLLPLPEDRLTVILLLGVNGVGKTTTAAKLAALYQAAGAKPVLAAADTFRAAAIDQLKIHGQRLGLRTVAHQQGGDPAAVVYDAIEAAGGGSGRNALVIADTAGRMHTKSALVEELRKIDRVVESKAPGAQYVKYLVLDATTGRNAFAQAEIFSEAVSPEAVILSKYDSTAKGGVVFSLASGLRLSVAYLCTGEKYGDIQTFNPHKFAREFAGME